MVRKIQWKLTLIVLICATQNAFANCDTAAGGITSEALLDPNIAPFSHVGMYVDDYDLITLLPFYIKTRALHVHWATEVPATAPVIIDAGAGTLLMSAAVAKARPDAKVLSLDMNSAMLDYGRKRGLPPENIFVSDITQMKGPSGKPLPNGTADHIFSHSVLWAIADPSLFFREARRTLRSQGTLAISTVRPVDKEIIEAFLKYLNEHLLVAERHGKITQAQRENFVNSNRDLLKVLHSPLTLDQLVALGEAHGFELLEAHDAYVVNTPSGPRAMFSQVLMRRTRRAPLPRTLATEMHMANSTLEHFFPRVSVSQARRGDVPRIAKFMNEIRAQFSTSLPSDLDRDLMEGFDHKFNSPNGNLLYIHTRDGKVLGTGGWTKVSDEKALVEKLYLDPILRGHHVGALLLKMVIDEARRRGIRVLELETLDNMTAANELYADFGFQRIDRPNRGVVNRFYRLELN